MEKAVEKPRLYHWHLSVVEWRGTLHTVVRGCVWGDDRFIDSDVMRTSEVKGIDYDYENLMQNWRMAVGR